MAITNGYCTLAELKASLNITDSVDDTALEAAITSASRMIDDYTERFFYVNGTTQSTVTRYYTPVDPYTVNIDDIITVSEIATDVLSGELEKLVKQSKELGVDFNSIPAYKEGKQAYGQINIIPKLIEEYNKPI